MTKKLKLPTIRSSAAEYLTFVKATIKQYLIVQNEKTWTVQRRFCSSILIKN